MVTRAQREACVAAIRKGLEAVRIPAPLTLADWADQHFYLSAESSAIEGRWETVPFQVEIMNCISNDDIRIIDWIKCARIGYTKILLAAAAYFLTHKKRSGVIYQPTDSDAQKFAKSEVDPMLRDVAECRRTFKGNVERRGSHNTLDFKQFLAALLYVLGGKSPGNYRRLTVDWVFYDELEGFDRDVGGEGDPVTLGDKRITVSPFPKSVRGSTPKLKRDSLIAGEAALASHLFVYRLTCPECEYPQPLIFGQLRWDKDDPSSVRYQCGHCEERWYYRDLYVLLEGGFWGTDDGCTIRDGNLEDATGMVIDWPRHIAFHIWAAYSPFFPWTELVEEWLEAIVQQRTEGKVEKLKTFTNTRLAEPWEEVGEQVDFDLLYARRESYARPPAGVLLLTAQFDIQENRIEGEIVGWGRGEENWGIEYLTLWGDPTQPEVWLELEEWLQTSYTTAPAEGDDGRELAIAAVVIDTGFLPDHVYAFWKRTAHPRVYCIKGVGGTDKPIATSPHARKSGRSKAPVPLFLMGSDTCKSIVYRRLQITEPGAGYSHFPDTYPEEYFRGLTAEKRILKHRRGYEYVEWIKTRPRNEPLDIRAMGVCAIAILNPLWDALDPQNAAPPAEDKPKDPYIPHAHRRGRGRSPGGGFVNRWRT